MSKVRKVNVEGGALYEITEYEGKYWASKVRSDWPGDSRTSVGSAKRLDEALALIKAHSGRQIRSIS